jgi:hypothetical protein
VYKRQQPAAGTGFVQQPRFGAFDERWTRSQRIRTAAAIPVVVPAVDASSAPVHVAIAAKTIRLHELGLSDRRIARALGVSDKTVAKVIRATALGHQSDENGQA